MSNIFEKYPELKDRVELLSQTRRNEILTEMLGADTEYNELCRERADTSMALYNALTAFKLDSLFDKYSDAIFAQECYELDAVYRQAVIDIIEVMQELRILG